MFSKSFFLVSKILVVSFAFMFVGCTDNSTNGVTPINNSKNKPLSLVQVPENVDLAATLTIYKTRSFNSTLNSFTNTTACDAAFYNGSGYSADAGGVAINNVNVHKYSYPTGKQIPDSMYAYGYQNYQGLNFNGNDYVWNISGSSSFASFSKTISSPKQEANIVFPANNATISKSQGLTIKWDCLPTPSCDTVVIRLTGTNNGIDKYVTDCGQFVLTANDLAGFTVGEEIELYLVKGNYNLTPIVNNKFALVSIMSINSILLNVAN